MRQSSDGGHIESIEDHDSFWSRTPRRFYDDEEAKEQFISVNRLETALEATRPVLQAPMLEASSGIKTTLLPFQKRALAWMYSMEADVLRDEGALLPHWISLRSKSRADVQTIHHQRNKRMKVSADMTNDTFYMDTLTGTLSRRRFASGKSEPGGCLCDSMGLGKSLTSLSLIEKHQRTSSYVDRSRSAQLTSKMNDDHKPFCARSTLLVVPASLVHQWYSEISKHLGIRSAEDQPGIVLRFQRGVTIPWTANDDRQTIRGRAKEVLASEDQASIVLATYEDLRSELQISKRSKKAISPLLDIHWWRIMLDEAQLVSTSNGNAAEMVNCLWRTNGWIITSTPFNSSIRDMYGLVTFLDSDFASKRLFEEMIAIPFVAGKEEGIRRAHSLLKRIMWRHRKEHVENELGLPPSTMQSLLLEKTGLEKSLYDREYKAMLEKVRDAVGLGRRLSKKQQDRFLSLRKLISHPQLASDLGYGGPGSQRTTFANLFADLIFRNQGDLYSAQMEYIVLLLKIAAGEKFRKEETVAGAWKGGIITFRRKIYKAKLEVARGYSAQGCERGLLYQKEEAARSLAERGREGEEEGKTVEGEEMEVEEGEEKEEEAEGVGRMEGVKHEEEEVQDRDKGEETSIRSDGHREREDGQGAVEPVKEVEVKTEGLVREQAPVSLRYDEALHWLEIICSTTSSAADTSFNAVYDPERLANLFFEKDVVEAHTVDMQDPRYHPILLDAGDEEEEVENGEIGQSTSEAVLLKNRFRGNVKRSVQKAWYYRPRRKLQSLCREVATVEGKINRLQGEANYLENRIREELGEERARLVLKEGFDALHGSLERVGQESRCLLCLEEIDVPGILPCLHSACFTCLTACVNKIGLGGKTPCPMCRLPFEKKDIIEVLPASDESDDVNEYGIKISGLIRHIRVQLEKDPTCKIVIFSAWSTHLDFLTEALNNLSPEPLLSVAFSGKGQSRALQEFKNDEQVRIILVPMRMGEGAAGLTLNNASVGYLLEPTLDASLVEQALGRINRIGQKAEKTTYFRVMVENTIEPALMQMAERRLRDQTDKEADTRHHDTLSVEELAFVFGLNVEEEKARKKVEVESRPSQRRVSALAMRPTEEADADMEDDDDDDEYENE
ncbi:hypothetical protein CBS101457_005294 [Exobasidium rhododendri]|nr:hypothetical protein CBS101457_005294 [Exobasidium rhododendri]